MMPCSSRVASPGERASSNAFHHRALTSGWWRSGSFPVTFLRAWTVQRCSSALRPELAGGLPDPGCPVGDHQRRGAQPAVDHVPAEREPRLIALAAPQSQSEQDLPALKRHAPADQDALRWVCRRGAASDRSRPGTGRRCRAASRRRRHHCRYRSRVSSQIRETVDFDAIGSSKTSSSAASTSRVDSPRRKPLRSPATPARGCARRPCRGSGSRTRACFASRTLGRSRRIAPLVVFTVFGS